MNEMESNFEEIKEKSSDSTNSRFNAKPFWNDKLQVLLNKVCET